MSSKDGGVIALQGKNQHEDEYVYPNVAYEGDVETNFDTNKVHDVVNDHGKHKTGALQASDINQEIDDTDTYEVIDNGKAPNEINSKSITEEPFKGELAETDDVVHAIDDDDDDFQGRMWKNIYKYTDSIQSTYDAHRDFFRIVITCFFLLGYTAYLIYACIYDFNEATIVLIITGITVFVYMYILVRNTMGEKINERVIAPGIRLWDAAWSKTKWFFGLAILAALGVGLYFLTRDEPYNLVSFGGLIFFVLFCYVFSKYPAKVKWRPVLWGLALQFLLGLFILRTYPGFVIFEWLSDVVFAFLNFASAGSEFLYGENYQEHYFAFTVLPIIIYFSSVISILYYWGVIQTMIQKVAWLMQCTMKTSASESLNAAANIFVGMTEAPLLIKPYLKDMTRSEIHAIMTGGFATVAGSTLGAYILAGIDATHLIAASVMSAPAALAISKLFYPETEQSKHITEDDVKLPKGEEHNFVEAAANGASAAIPLVLNIAANLIAFLSLLALVNALLGYFGGLVGYPELTFELICSYVFMPLAFIMGVEWKDCNIVAELIGLKTFVNEFYAYDVLAQYIKNRETGEGETLSERSEIIATYALCGFANIGSIGIMLGGLAPMAPDRKPDLAAVALRALVAGTVACFLTACIAGILYVPGEIVMSNTTTPTIPHLTELY